LFFNKAYDGNEVYARRHYHNAISLRRTCICQSLGFRYALVDSQLRHSQSTYSRVSVVTSGKAYAIHEDHDVTKI